MQAPTATTAHHVSKRAEPKQKTTEWNESKTKAAAVPAERGQQNEEAG